MKIIVKNIGRILILADQIIVSGNAFLVGVLAARALGVELFGVYALMWSGCLLVISIQQAAITTPFMSLYPKLAGSLRVNYLQGTIGQQLGLMLITGAVASLLNSGLDTLQILTDVTISKSIPFFIAAMLAAQLHDFFRRVMQANMNHVKTFLMDIFTCGAQVLGVFWQVKYKSFTLDNLYIILAFSYIAGIIPVFDLFLRFRVDRKNIFSAAEKNWSMGKWLVPSIALQWPASNLYMIAATYFHGAASAGLMRMVQSIVGVLHILYTSLENSLPVKAAQIINESGFSDAIKYVYKICIRAGCIIVAPMVVAIFWPNEVLKIIYNQGIENAESIVRLYCVLYVFVYIGIPFRSIIRAAEKAELIFKAYLVAFLVSLAIFMPLGYYFGVKGAVFGLIVNQMCVIGVYLFAVKKIQENL